jgi:nucleotide-binding universal stress UspA family protein
MTRSASQPPNAVVVRVDGHEAGDRAVDAAIPQARTLHRPLHLVFATGIGVVPWTPELLAARDRLTMRCHERAVALAPDLEISWSVHVANSAAMLVAASESASMVVLTEEGLGQSGDVLLGGTTHKVVAHARCPVMVVPNSGELSEHGPVVVGVDIAEHSVPALAWAFAEASARRARLVALHASWWEEPSLLLDVPPRDEPAWADIVDAEGLQLSEMLAGWREKHPDVEVEPTVVHERSAAALEASSTGSQLLVVGSRGRGGFTGLLLGSVSAHAVHHSHCPVVVVPSTVRGPGRPMTGESS